MRRFQITGMSCAACSARVEKAVRAVPGVQRCEVNLLTNSMQLEGSVESAEIVRAVRQAGYGAAEMSDAPAASPAPADDPANAKAEARAIRARLIASLVLLAALMYLSMFGVMWGAPLPRYLYLNPTVIGLIELLLAAAIMVINQKFFIVGVRGLLHGAPNMDTLVALGSAASFGYSTYLLLRMCETSIADEPHLLKMMLHGMYFESAAMILTLITLGKLLESRAKGKTTDALRALMSLAPQTATVIRDGEERTVPIAQITRGELFVVRPGDRIPVDGVVLEGSAAVDESALSGESIPVDKQPGDTVSAATVNQSGYLRCRAERVGEDTTISQIIRMVSDAAATKAPIAKLADRVSGVFVPVVLGISLLTLLGWLLLSDQGVGFAVGRAISVLVISCPCALGLATPVAIMVGNGVGAKHGILFKNAAALEHTGRVSIVALDKTGTITKGEPSVTDVCPAPAYRAQDFLALAAALEQHSEHPLGKAVVRKAMADGVPLRAVSDFQAHPGAVRATLQEKNGTVRALIGGKQAMVEETIGAPLPAAVLQEADALAEQGKTPLYFAADGEYLGMIAVADIIKPDSAQAIREWKRMGLRTVMLTGDNPKTAQAVGQAAGVDEIIAGVLPQEKEAVIRSLQTQGRVAMIGDGINDAPALTRADAGIAIGAGTDVAIEAADVVLMNSSLLDAVNAIRLSRATLRNIRQNLFWAFFYNGIGIPLAAGVLIHSLGWEMSPMLGAAAMSLSSFCVVSNALRLKRFRAIRAEALQENMISEKEEKTMSEALTIRVEGMMCPHCSGRVKTLLEALEGVASAQVSHEAGTAIVTLADGDADAVRAACEKEIVAAGYRVVG